MGVRIDTTKDHRLLAETPESILYCSKTVEAPVADVSTWPTLVGVEVWPIDKRRLQGDSLLATMDLTVRMSKEQAQGIVPKLDDIWKRVLDSTFWVVKIVDVLSFGNEYRLHCKKSTKR